jgi:hypothetical protein
MDVIISNGMIFMLQNLDYVGPIDNLEILHAPTIVEA